MVKSGSQGNPLILRVADESKAQLVAEICFENDWQFILGIEPDQEADLSDLERNLNPPVRHEVRKIGRNKPCTCDSGKKFKKCCGANV